MEAHKGIIMCDISLYIDIIRTLINMETYYLLLDSHVIFFLNEIMILNSNMYPRNHPIFLNLKFLSPNKIKLRFH